jgi:hypothetical protein
MRVYVHDEENDFTVALDWEESDKSNIEKLKTTFIGKQKKFTDISQFDLVNERGKDVTIIKNKLDVFVKRSAKINSNSTQNESITPKSSVTTSNIEGTTSKMNTIPPNVIETVSKLSQDAATLFEKKKFNVCNVTLFICLTIFRKLYKFMRNYLAWV